MSITGRVGNASDKMGCRIGSQIKLEDSRGELKAFGMLTANL